jgi:hypothetical protein
VATLISAASVARGAEPEVPLDAHVEGSFPLQYIDTTRTNSRQQTMSAAPFLALSATAHWKPDLYSSVFVSGGRPALGNFRENDNTFTSFGGDTVKQWGAFTAGAAFEHIQYYNGSFAEPANTANDFSVFMRYRWLANADLRITPTFAATSRLDEALAVQRYTYGGGIGIEQRLYRSWWLIVQPRMRYSNYVNNEAGRRDLALSIVTGLKYEFNEAINLRAIVGFEGRSSTDPSKSSDKFVAGVSLDFEFDFERPVGWRRMGY